MMEMYLTFPNIIIHFDVMWVCWGKRIVDHGWFGSMHRIYTYRKVLASCWQTIYCVWACCIM